MAAMLARWTEVPCEGSNCDTHAYARAVNARGLCGARDWRLPTVGELVSIVNNDRTNPAIDTTFFKYIGGTRSNEYWSSSSSYFYFPSLGAIEASYVDFGYGNVDGSKKRRTVYVRLVRGGK